MATVSPIYEATVAFRRRMIGAIINTADAPVVSQALSTDVWRHNIIPFLYYPKKSWRLRDETSDRYDPPIVALARTCRATRWAVEASLAAKVLERWHVYHACTYYEKQLAPEAELARKKLYAILGSIWNKVNPVQLKAALEDVKKASASQKGPAIPLFFKEGKLEYATNLPSFILFREAKNVTKENLDVLIDSGLCDPASEPLVRYAATTEFNDEKRMAEVIQHLVTKYKCNVNRGGITDGATALHAAVLDNHPNVAKLLLSLGADPYAPMLRDSAELQEGVTPVDAVVSMRGNPHRTVGEAEAMKKVFEDADVKM